MAVSFVAESVHRTRSDSVTSMDEVGWRCCDSFVIRSNKDVATERSKSMSQAQEEMEAVCRPASAQNHAWVTRQVPRWRRGRFLAIIMH
jgi:hypothetical protein